VIDKIWKIGCLVAVLAITVGVEVVRSTVVSNSYSSVQMGAPRKGAIKYPKRR